MTDTDSRGGVGKLDTLSRTGNRGRIGTLASDPSPRGATEPLAVGPDVRNEAPDPREA
jgi:hypothetical protein